MFDGNNMRSTGPEDAQRAPGEHGSEGRPGPSKGMKILAVLVFFIVLFMLADMLGLPLPTGVVIGFFFTIALPLSMLMAMTLLTVLYVIRRSTGRLGGLRLFDVSLQAILVGSLFATGLFLLRFPEWLREGYPAIRAELVAHISDDHSEGERERFLSAMDEFWAWNTRMLLDRREAPDIQQQEGIRDVLIGLGDAMAPACPGCDPELTREETRTLAERIDEMLGRSTAGEDAGEGAMEANGRQPAEVSR